jgi:hypothetical protein
LRTPRGSRWEWRYSSNHSYGRHWMGWAVTFVTQPLFTLRDSPYYPLSRTWCGLQGRSGKRNTIPWASLLNPRPLMKKKAEENTEKQRNNERKNQTKSKAVLTVALSQKLRSSVEVPKCHLSHCVALVTWTISPSPLRVAPTRAIACHGTQCTLSLKSQFCNCADIPHSSLRFRLIWWHGCQIYMAVY